MNAMLALDHGAAELVYFMEAEGFGVKIGHSNNPRRRLAEIKSHCPFAVKLLFAVEGGAKREKSLHLEFHADKIRGEWFHASTHLRARLADIGSQETCFHFPQLVEKKAEKLDNPVRRVIAKCGNGDFSRGIDAICRWTRKHRSNVYRWASNGLIPTQDQQTILPSAQREGIALLAEDFFYTTDELAPRLVQAGAE